MSMKYTELPGNDREEEVEAEEIGREHEGDGDDSCPRHLGSRIEGYVSIYGNNE
jgi:hypothetical protein